MPEIRSVSTMDEETRMDAQTIDGLVLLIDGIRGQASYAARLPTRNGKCLRPLLLATIRQI